MNFEGDLYANLQHKDDVETNKTLAREIDFYGHKIQLISQENATPFTDKHVERIIPILEFYWLIDPRVVQGYTQFVSENKDEVSENGRFPLNGENGSCIGKESEGAHGAIYFTKLGMDISIPHRISSADNQGEEGFVDNFSGTVAHEIAHGGAITHQVRPAGFFYDTDLRNQFYREWQNQFGWEHSIVDGKVVFRTSQPEKCIGGTDGYAAISPEEDMPDSLAALILNPNIVHPEKREFLKEKIKEYKQKTKK